MATELAQGYLSLSVGLDHPGEGLAKYLGEQQRIADRAGKQMGQSLSQGVADGSEKAKAATERARVAFEAASRAASDAAAKHEAADRKVQIAEAKLAEAQDKYAAGSSQLLTAEDRLASAKQARSRLALDVAAAEHKQTEAQQTLTRATEEQATAEKQVGEEAGRSTTAIGRIKQAMSRMSSGANPFRSFSGKAAQAGSESGGRFTSGFTRTADTGMSKASTSMAGRLRNAFHTGIGGALGGAIGGQITAIAGKVASAIGSGVQRLDSIDQAKAKLTGLGNSASQTQTIMDNALASVKGTAFGMGEAATTAAGAVAAGIKPGKELEAELKLVADSATIGGASMEEMGAIFNKVATSGKLQGDELQQLGDRGIPIVDLLAKSMGKTSAEVYKLSSAGKIGFADFQKAMSMGMGGAALSSGDTFAGAMDNAKAALGRLGASFLKGSFAQGPGLFKSLTQQIDKLGPIAEKAGTFLSNGLGKAIEGVKKAFTAAQPTITGVFTTIRQAVDVFVGWWTGKGSDVETAWSEPLGELAGVMEWRFEQIKTAAVKVWGGLKPVIGGVVKVVGSLVGPVRDVVTAFAEMGPGESGIWDKVASALKAVGKALSAIGDFISRHQEAVSTILGAVAASVGTLLAAKAAIGGVAKTIGVASNAIKGVKAAMEAMRLAMATNPFTIIIAGVAALVVGLVYAYKHSETFRNTVNKAFGAVKAAAAAVGNWFSGPFVGFFTSTWNAIKSVFSTVGGFFAGMWNGIRAGVSAAIGAVHTIVTNAWNAAKGLWATIRTSAVTAWTNLVAVFGPVFSRALDGIKTILRNAWNVIGGIINTFIGLFTGNWRKAWDGVKQVVTSSLALVRSIISTGLTFVIGLVKGFGTLLVRGFVVTFNAVRNAVTAGWKAIRTAFSLAMTAVATLWRAGWNGIKTVFSKVWHSIPGIVTTVWNAIKRAFTSGIDAVKRGWTNGWNSIKSTGTRIMTSTKDAIVRVVNSLPKAFSSAVAAIGRAWNGLKEAAKKPVSFVINTVINHGIIGGFNTVAKALGAKQMAKVSVKGFSSGGFIDLPWSAANRDPYLGVTTAGAPLRFEGQEFIVNRDATARWRPLLEAINSNRVPGYAGGGIVGGASKAWNFVKSTAGGIWNGFKSVGAWVVAAIKKIIGDPVAKVVGRFGHGEFISTIAAMPKKLLDAVVKAAEKKLSPGGAIGNFAMPSGSGISRWAPLVAQALAFTGIGGGPRDVAAWLRQIRTESDGNPNLVQSSAVYDINIAHGDPARGLVQVPKVTWDDFGRDMGPFFPNVYNPLKNLIVGMRAASRQHHNWRAVIGFGHGYLDGGTVATSGRAWLSEDGRPELVVGPQMQQLTRGSRVFNADQTARIISGTSGVRPVVINVRDVDDVLLGTMYGTAQDAITDNADRLARMGA